MEKNFDPNGVGVARSGIFGLPFSVAEAQIALIPAPWGVTVSYGGGTENGPRAIYEASPQIDYFHETYGADSWKLGIAMLPLKEWNASYKEGLKLRKLATKAITGLERGKSASAKELKVVNDSCAKFHDHIEKTASELLSTKKLVGLIGGDHSTPLGLMRALAKKEGDFGILQIDAHCDLRDSYEGFTYSHASIMHNALKIPQVKKLTQVGIRDYSIGEKAVIDSSKDRIVTFFDADIKRSEYEGIKWQRTVDDIVDSLPKKVYISFDIDGLDPKLCPHTGTPVPGGLEFDRAIYLIRAVAESGKRIIGFDVNEVSPGNDPAAAKAMAGTWDANVGMRVLWNLAMWSAKSNDLKPLA